MRSRQMSQESFTSCHSTPSLNSERQTRTTNTRRSIEEQHVLAVSNLKGKGKVIQLRDVCFDFLEITYRDTLIC